MMRIGIFVVMFPKLSETFIVTKVLKLLDAGFDVQIFSFAESTDWARFAVLDGRDDVRARVHVVPPLHPPWRVATLGAGEVVRTAVQHPSAFARLAAHTWRTRRETPLGFAKSFYQRLRFVGHELDVLHIEFDSQGIGIADLKDYFDCRILLSSRGTFQDSSVRDRMPDATEYLFRYADGYHFISQFVDDNTRELGLPADLPTWHVQPAIDLSLFQPVPREVRSGPLHVVSVGRLEWTKGYEFALDAIARVHRAGVPIRYTIYGEGAYEEAIRHGIRYHGIHEVVHLAGALPRERIPAALGDADVMLHAALAEAFSNAVIEAQAMEIPVVTSDAGGLPENVEDGVTGFVVPRRDPVAMADRLIVLARDPELRRKLGAAGRARALERFDLDRQAEAFVRLYTELVQLPRRRR